MRKFKKLLATTLALALTVSAAVSAPAITANAAETDETVIELQLTDETEEVTVAEYSEADIEEVSESVESDSADVVEIGDVTFEDIDANTPDYIDVDSETTAAKHGELVINPTFVNSKHLVNKYVTVPFYVYSYGDYTGEKYHIQILRGNWSAYSTVYNGTFLSTNSAQLGSFDLYIGTAGTYLVQYWTDGNPNKQTIAFFVDKYGSLPITPVGITTQTVAQGQTKMIANVSCETPVKYSWYASYDGGNTWAQLAVNQFTNEFTLSAAWYNSPILISCKVKHIDTTSDVEISMGTSYTQYKYIKGICQMPYQGGGYLIGFETFSNPNNSYYYEMLIYDCSANMWAMSSGKLRTNGTCLWTVWQPQYGYYWTLFRVYDKNGKQLDEVCYPFVNAY